MYSQLQSNVPIPGEERYNGMFDCLRKIVKNEGYVLSRSMVETRKREKRLMRLQIVSPVYIAVFLRRF